MQYNNTDKFTFYYDTTANLSSMELNGAIYHYLRNAQGDITGITDSQFNLVARYFYDTWGKLIKIEDGSGNDITNNTSSIGYKNPFRYRGYYYDVETGLYYVSSRYYDPEVCRFINADDIGYLGANNSILGYNLFAYCDNNSVNYTDPAGYNKILNINRLETDSGVGGGGGIVVLGLLYLLCRGISNIVISTYELFKKPTYKISTEEKLSEIASGYELYECVEAQKAMTKYLKKKKLDFTIIELEVKNRSQLDYPFIISDMYPRKAVSDNGYHVGVKYKDKVYCNIHPYGLPEEEWINDFKSFYPMEIRRTPITF